ncbi:hypothetical protein BKA67DRAFT_165402 [Truncatella angustata]|uniref:Uncharacterized protein n=1 Tax=Truncatella angustata TaxID=152316 RepID=A0A9P9A169_9PEZI|nr:uncharacterized protein BKA67DRAFT_165402 [Truncatella angustata]KAH6656720.1 hypothetical protein BKA67DRAFT_165402 [Truncatella angustata]
MFKHILPFAYILEHAFGYSIPQSPITTWECCRSQSSLLCFLSLWPLELLRPNSCNINSTPCCLARYLPRR